MMPTFNMLDAKSNLSRLVEAVESGAETEIIIARNGRPAARLVPVIREDASKRIGLLKGMYPDMSLEEFDADNQEITRAFNGHDRDGGEQD